MVALLVGQIVEQTAAPYTWLPWVIVAWVAAVGGGRAVAGASAPAPARRAGALLAAGERAEPAAPASRSWRADGLRDRHRRRLAERQGGAVRRGRRRHRRGQRAVRDEPPRERLGRAGSGRLGARNRADGPRAARARGRRAARGRDARPRLPGRRPGGDRRASAAPAPCDHLARPARHRAVRRAERRGRRGRADRPDRPQSRRLAHRAEGDVAARRRARALPRGALAGAGRRPPERLADRRGGPGPGQRVLDAALRPALGRLGPRAGRAGRARRRQAAADPARGRGDRAAPAEAAEALGLSTRCHVAVGTGDEHGAALGAGAVSPGRRGRRDRHGRAGRGPLDGARARRASGWSRRTRMPWRTCC